MARTETRNGLGFRPLYRQARDVLVGRINDGIWQAGQVLPSEMEIAADLGVSQGTARKALDEMESENLVVRHQGRGTFVIGTLKQDRWLKVETTLSDLAEVYRDT